MYKVRLSYLAAPAGWPSGEMLFLKERPNEITSNRAGHLAPICSFRLSVIYLAPAAGNLLGRPPPLGPLDGADERETTN